MLPIIGAVAAALVVVTFVFIFFGTQSETDDIQNKLLGKRILIKELENLSSEDSDKNLARGIQNQLISGLSPTILLPVVPKEETDRINSENIPLEDLQSKHNIGFVISGSSSVQGKKFRVNLELLDVDKQKTVWSYMKDFLTDDSFGAQDEIEFDVRKAIQEKFTMGEAFSDSFIKYFGKGELYRNALKAWASFQRKDSETSGNNYSEAFKKIKDDNPDNSQAHLLYAISLFNEQEGADYNEKRKNILKSVRLANTLDPNNSMAYPVKAFIEYRFAEETNLRSVIAFTGLDMEPDNYLTLVWTGHAFWHQDAVVSKFDTEILFNSEYFENAIELAPYGPSTTKIFLLASYSEEKKRKDADILVEEMLEDSDKNLNFLGTISKVFLLSEKGKQEEAKQTLKEFMNRNEFSPTDILDNFFRFPFDKIHEVFFNLRYLPPIQEAMGMNAQQLESYLYNK